MTTQRANPMAGPAYVKALQNALEKRMNEYRNPPRTGGTQISTRFDEFVLNHVDGIVEESGWNRDRAPGRGVGAVILSSVGRSIRLPQSAE